MIKLKQLIEARTLKDIETYIERGGLGRENSNYAIQHNKVTPEEADLLMPAIKNFDAGGKFEWPNDALAKKVLNILRREPRTPDSGFNYPTNHKTKYDSPKKLEPTTPPLSKDVVSARMKDIERRLSSG